MSSMDKGRCELCGRDKVLLTVHHLTPRELGGTFEPTAQLCRACHRQIHALYTNEDLLTFRLTTIPNLLQDKRIQAYVHYIRKQPADVLPKLHKSERVRGKK